MFENKIEKWKNNFENWRDTIKLSKCLNLATQSIHLCPMKTLILMNTNKLIQNHIK